MLVRNLGSTGNVTVVGAGSVKNSGDLTVGAFGTGRLEILVVCEYRVRPYWLAGIETRLGWVTSAAPDRSGQGLYLLRNVGISGKGTLTIREGGTVSTAA